MKSYRELEIFQQSRTLAIDVHRMTLSLPKFEIYEEGSQVRRSSKSVTTAIVEGYCRRRYKNDFIRYLVYALAECDETRVHLAFLADTDSLKDGLLRYELEHAYELLSKKLNRFLQWVEKDYKEENGSK